MKIYRNRSNLLRPLLFGVSLTYIAIDNINNGPLREYLSIHFDLKEFGTNTREEYLYYFILFLGVLELLIMLQSFFLPIIEVIDSKIALRTKERTLVVIRDVVDINSIKKSSDSNLLFNFEDAQFNVNVDDISPKDLQALYEIFNIEEEE